jgi:hypothetical protein
MNDFLTSLRSELAAARQTVGVRENEVLQAQERLKRACDKVEHLEALVPVYEADAPAAVELAELPLPPAPEARGALRAGVEQQFLHTPPAAIQSKKSAMESEIDTLLILHGTAPRKAILDHLVGRQIMGREADPLRSLSVFLANHKDRYVSDGKGNYRLRQNGHSQPPPAPNGAGSAGVGDAAASSAHP